MENSEKVVHRRRNVHRQIVTALLATVPTFTYGLQIGWLSPNSSILKSTNGTAGAQALVTDRDISWMAAGLPLAAMLGLPFFSYFSDKFGRKKSIIIVSLLSCISWICKLMATHAALFIFARIIAGLAAGGCFVVVPVYVKEISKDTLRGALGSLVMTVCKLGVIAVYVTGMFLTYNVNHILYLTISTVHAVAFCFMPESPNFLVTQGKEKAATKTIAWLRSVPRDDPLVMDVLVNLKEEKRRSDAMPKTTIRSFFNDRPSFGALRLILTLMAMQTLSGCFALMNYAADVFHRAGTALHPNTLAMFVGALQLTGSAFTTLSIERFGRKIPLASSCLAISICQCTVATYFLLNATAHASIVPSWLPSLAVCLCIFAYGSGLAPVPFVVMTEIFRYELRTTMAGVAMSLSFFCSSMTVLFYTPIANSIGPYVVFYLFGAVGLFGAVYTILCVPETKGKSLAEIQEYWLKKNSVVEDD